MRALILFLLALLVVWGFYRVYPSYAGQGEEPAGVQAEPEDGRFLEPLFPDPSAGAPAGSSAAAAAPDATRVPATPPPAPAVARPEPPLPVARAGESPFERSSGGGQGVPLAALVLHADPEQVARFAEARLTEADRDLALAAVAFAEARSGQLGRARELVPDPEELSGLTAEERGLMGLALGLQTGDRGARPLLGGTSPLALAMSMALLEQSADQALASERYPEAARTYSRLLLREIDAPWPSDRGTLARWTQKLNRAQEHHRWDPRGSWPSIDVEVQPGDSLTLIRKRVVAARPGLKVCTGLIERASGFREDEMLHPGDQLRVPTDPVSTIVDIDSRWLFYLFGDEVACAFEVAVGAPGSDTTPGLYEAGDKQENPTWFPEGRQPVLFGDPENPLGTRWIAWTPVEGGGRGLGYHGTWHPETVGQAVSDGCIRLRNEDVELLYRILPKGSPISVRP